MIKKKNIKSSDVSRMKHLMKDGGVVPETKPQPEKKIEKTLPAVEITAQGPSVQQIRDRYGDFDYTPRVRKMMTEARKQEQQKADGGTVTLSPEELAQQKLTKKTGIAAAGADAVQGITSSFGDDNKTGGVGNAVATAGNVLGDTSSMAATGASVAGPVGAVVGAGVGLAKGVIGAIKGGQEKRAMLQEKQNQQDKKELAGISAGMAEGGKITGKGTAKSDSIPSKLDEGDFIIPAENADKAMAMGVKHLGWKKNQRASLQDGQEPVKVSNGEVRFTRDEREYLEEVGENVKGLAPNAKSGNKFSEGGGTKAKPTRTEYELDNNNNLVRKVVEGEGGSSEGRVYKNGKFVSEPTGKSQTLLKPSISPAQSLDTVKSPKLADTPDYNKIYPTPPKGGSKFGDWMKKNPGVALGTAQTVAGLAGSARTNKEANAIQDIQSPAPTYNTEAEKLKATADQTVSAIMNGTNKQNADAMGNYMRVAKESGGSNAAAVLGNSAKMTSAGADSYLKGMQTAAQLKMNAQDKSSDLRTQGARATMDADATNRQFKERRIEQKREIANNNINAGIQNVSGQLMRSDYLDRMADTKKKYKNNLTGKYRKGGIVKSKKAC